MDLNPQFDDVLDNENVDTIILTLPVHDLRSPSANVVDSNESPPSTVVLNTNNSASEDDMAINSTSLVRSDCGQLFLVTYDDSNQNASTKHCFNLQIDAEQLLELKYPIDDFYKPTDQQIDTSELPDVTDVQSVGDTLQLAMQEIDAEGEAIEPVPYEVKLAALEAMMLPDGESSGEGVNRLFNCGVCFKTFTRRYELKTHLSRHFGMNVSLCPFCGKQFSHPSNLVRHVRIHTGSKPYKCKDCGKRFNQANSLHTHRASLHGSGSHKFACPLCGRNYKTSHLLKRHCRIVHRDENIRLDFSVPQNAGTVPSRRHFYCSECGESFAEKKQLKEHQEGHVLADESAEKEDEIQPELQLNLEAIDCMLREIQNGENGDPVEETLEAHVPDESRYAETIEEVVRKVRDLVCFECGKKFHRYISYKQHWGVHESSMRSYECSECGMAFAWKSTYTKHVAQHSIPVNSEPTILIQCSHQGCDKRYKTVGQMQEHVKRDHFMIRRFQCDDCDKQFYKAHDLLVHKRTHSKEKPYLCGTCGKSFSHVSHLIRHEKSHQNIRPYTCPVCKKSFTQATVLKAHRRKKCPDPVEVAPPSPVFRPTS